LRAIPFVLAIAGCVDVAPEFNCAPGGSACVDSQGHQGRCEASGNCSFADDTCGMGGLRYDASAAPGREGICVLAASSPSVTAAQPLGSNHVIAFEITTPAQTVVFDTEAPGTGIVASLHWFAGPCPAMSAEQASTTETCSVEVARRISVVVDTAGPFCLVAAADDPMQSGDVALRVFPGVSAPSCSR
jgi:hypothetical protein